MHYDKRSHFESLGFLYKLLYNFVGLSGMMRTFQKNRFTKKTNFLVDLKILSLKKNWYVFSF